MTDAEKLVSLYTNYFDEGVGHIVLLPGAGSNRKYYRLQGESRSVIGVVGDNIADCHAFTALSAAMRSAGVNVPEVYCQSDDSLYYIQEDLGRDSLFSLLGTASAESYVELTMNSLARLQCVEKCRWQDKVVYGEFSRRQIFWDLNYFKYEYLKTSGIDFNEELLEDDFESLASSLIGVDKTMWGFMYRDCQSRNIMIKDEIPYFIDYQGGRFGPSIYDAVSFLWQAKAGFSREFRYKMLEVYAAEYSELRGVEKQQLLSSVDHFVLFRTLQVLGAYGLRGIVEKKAHFIESIPGALANLQELLSCGVLDSYPELKRVSELMIADSRFEKLPVGKLNIRVFSFSYKKGYPADYSGNGGGFMFDCRGMHNPGRYDEYKPLTGMDRPVIEFLEERGEVQPFVSRVIELIQPTIETYVRRGFTSLQIGFGCTGGRHRSVYCAERITEKIHAAYGEKVNLELIHREQDVVKRF